jgi:hypothetical protein
MDQVSTGFIIFVSVVVYDGKLLSDLGSTPIQGHHTRTLIASNPGCVVQFITEYILVL